MDNPDMMNLLVAITEWRKIYADARNERYVVFCEVPSLGHISTATNKNSLSKASWDLLQKVGGAKKKTTKTKRLLKEIDACVKVEWAYAVYVKLNADGSYAINPQTREQFDKIWDMVEYAVERMNEE